jgi:peptide/nickel transport system substrate-binding protein
MAETSGAAGSCVFVALSALLVATAGCGGRDPAAPPASVTTLRIGFGLSTGSGTDTGIGQIARGIALEGLLNYPPADGRPQPRLAEKWSVSDDGRTWQFQLRRGVAFHNARAATASVVRESLMRVLPDQMGPAVRDIQEIRAVGDHELQILLKRRSALLIEGLDVLLPFPGESEVGIGPFSVSRSGNDIEMRANESYYGGKPNIERIVFKPYESIRSAWADMLRGEVDMLYEVGVDALDSMQPSTQTGVFAFNRNYDYVLFLNVQRPVLRDKAFRRALNAAIDREALVREILNGHGAPADGPVWPSHWAYDSQLPRFQYQPVEQTGARRRLRCIFGDPSLERLALFVQRQLQAVGVDLELELQPLDQTMERVNRGDFEVFLADAAHGPTLIRPYYFWHSDGPFNYGGFESRDVDAALDAIRDASNDDAYRAGVAAFQRAIVDDPPAVFLAWTQRARAVSTRFQVPMEPGRDILSTLRLWRPVGQARAAGRN